MYDPNYQTACDDVAIYDPAFAETQIEEIRRRVTQQKKATTKPATRKERAPNAPVLTAWNIAPKGEGKKGNDWTKLGAAWAHKDGRGFQVKTDAHPTNGKLVLRAAAGVDTDTLNVAVMNCYTIVRREGKAPFWKLLGVAEPHKNGKGCTVALKALPLDGVYVLRLPKEEVEPDAGATV